MVRLLIPTDGSGLAERAMAAMGPWTRQWGAEVVLMRVISPGEARDTVAEYTRRVPDSETRQQAMRGLPVEPARALAEDRGQALERIRTEIEDSLRELARTHLVGVSTQIHAIWSDNVADAIVAAANDFGASFIAMASHGRSGLGQAILGSVASEVVRHSPVPVIVINEHVVAS